MLTAKLCVTTPNLLIRQSLNELVQAAIYKHLPSEEHDGHSAANGKKFKKSVFQAIYSGSEININFSSLDKSHEEALAKAILKGDFYLGAIHIANTQVSLQLKNVAESVNTIEVDGYVCVHIKDAFNKRLYIEPRDSRFAQIVTKNAIEKYEALLGEPFCDKLEIKTLWQDKKPTIIFYKAAKHETYKARYLLNAPAKMLNFILDTGLGSKIMQGCGWVNMIKNKNV